MFYKQFIVVHLLNQSLDEGDIPADCKHAEVTAIYKKVIKVIQVTIDLYH